MTKKSLIFSTAVLAVLACAGTTFSAFAADVSVTGDITKNVTVGTVDETVYSVDITWGDMAFDWKYDEATEAFRFVGKRGCVQVGVGGNEESSDSPNFDGLFEDNACTEPATGASSGPFYANMLTGGTIDVVDSTTNGQIKARASFVPEDDYSWVVGKLSSVIYADDNYDFSQDLDDGYLETIAGGPVSRILNGVLYLEGDDVHVYSDSVTAGDKIGTITLTIEPDLN